MSFGLSLIPLPELSPCKDFICLLTVFGFHLPVFSVKLTDLFKENLHQR